MSDENRKLVATFDGIYNRTGTIEAVDGVCNVCRESKRVLEIDGSQGEYTAGCICLACATDALQTEN